MSRALSCRRQWALVSAAGVWFLTFDKRSEAMEVAASSPGCKVVPFAEAGRSAGRARLAIPPLFFAVPVLSRQSQNAEHSSAGESLHLENSAASNLTDRARAAVRPFDDAVRRGPSRAASHPSDFRNPIGLPRSQGSAEVSIHG